jgi:hypothetical protein
VADFSLPAIYAMVFKVPENLTLGFQTLVQAPAPAHSWLLLQKKNLLLSHLKNILKVSECPFSLVEDGQ